MTTSNRRCCPRSRRSNGVAARRWATSATRHFWTSCGCSPVPAGRLTTSLADSPAKQSLPPPTMAGVNPSTALARVLVDELIACGVTDAVLAPGSRNAPLSMALHDADATGRLRLHVRIDERTAGFLARRAGPRVGATGGGRHHLGNRGGQPASGGAGGASRRRAAAGAVRRSAAVAARRRRQPGHRPADAVRAGAPVLSRIRCRRNGSRDRTRPGGRWSAGPSAAARGAGGRRRTGAAEPAAGRTAAARRRRRARPAAGRLAGIAGRPGRPWTTVVGSDDTFGPPVPAPGRRGAGAVRRRPDPSLGRGRSPTPASWWSPRPAARPVRRC